MIKIKNFYHQSRRFLAKLWLNINLQLQIVGITGSYGKTGVVTVVSKVLGAKFSVNKTDTNLDTVFNLPITILKTKIWNEVLVLEYGIDHKGEMDSHLSLVKPKIVVLTGISPVHSDEEHLGSLENIIIEKTKLINSIPDDGLAIFNFDDPIVRKIGENFLKPKKFYGTSKKADIWADNIKMTSEGTSFTLCKKEKKILIKTGLIGYPAVSNCLAAYIVGCEFKVEENQILEKLKELKPLKGRLSFEKGPLGSNLLNDSLRANPASTISGLKTLSQFSGRKIAVLGEMGELGELEEKMHRLVGKEIAGLKIDYLVGVGPLTKYIIAEAEKNGFDKKRCYWAKDVKQAAEILKKILKDGDIFYLKASLLRHLERIILILNGEKVCCNEIVCHYYQKCSTCPKLLKCIQ